MLPSGIFYPDCLAVIAHGVVVQPLQLVEEIRNARALGLSLQNLALSANAPLILPFHQQLDVVFEDSRYQRIGTTRRGIGPAYEDVVGRRALFVGDLLRENVFRDKIARLAEYYNRLFAAYGHPAEDLEDAIRRYLEAGEFLRPHVTDTIAAAAASPGRRKRRSSSKGPRGACWTSTWAPIPSSPPPTPPSPAYFPGPGSRPRPSTA